MLIISCLLNDRSRQVQAFCLLPTDITDSALNSEFKIVDIAGPKYSQSFDNITKKFFFSQYTECYNVMVWFSVGIDKPFPFTLHMCLFSGRNLNGIHFAMNFLSTWQSKQMSLNGKDKQGEMDEALMLSMARGKDVVVIGGGDTGNDCIGTSLRQVSKLLEGTFHRQARNLIYGAPLLETYLLI